MDTVVLTPFDSAVLFGLLRGANSPLPESAAFMPLAEALIACNGTQNRMAVLDSFLADRPDAEYIRQSLFESNGNLSVGQLAGVWAEDVGERAVQWNWRGRIPRGELTIMSSDPGRGKSVLTCAITAILTTGGLWPDGTRAPLGNVLLMAAEDDAETTIRPRLRAAGADLSRVLIVTEFPTFPENILELEVTIRRNRIIQAMLDPISSFMSAKLDTHRDASTRQALTPLTDLARRCECGLLGIMHLTKAPAERALYRLNGSTAFGAAARSVLGVGVDPNDPGQHLIASLKGNLARTPPVMAYRIKSFDTGMVDDTGIAVTVPVIDWGDEMEMDAADIFAGDKPQRNSQRQTAEIDAWIEKQLAGGPMLRGDLNALGKNEGYSPDQIWRAGERVGVTRSKVGFQGNWLWELKR